MMHTRTCTNYDTYIVIINNCFWWGFFFLRTQMRDEQKVSTPEYVLSFLHLCYLFSRSILLCFLQSFSKQRLQNVWNCEKTLTSDQMNYVSPWCNQSGWLGLKNQLPTILLIDCMVRISRHLSSPCYVWGKMCSYKFIYMYSLFLICVFNNVFQLSFFPAWIVSKVTSFFCFALCWFGSMPPPTPVPPTCYNHVKYKWYTTDLSYHQRKAKSKQQVRGWFKLLVSVIFVFLSGTWWKASWVLSSCSHCEMEEGGGGA